MWYSRRLAVYTAGGEPSGGVKKEEIQGGMWIACRLVVHAVGTGNDEEVGIGEIGRAHV